MKKCVQLRELLSVSEGDLQLSEELALKLDRISKLLDSLNVNWSEELQSDTHLGEENIYIEFTPEGRKILSTQLLRIFNEMYEPNSKLDNCDQCKLDSSDYKLMVGPDGLKLELENQKNFIKLFRFILPLD